MALDPISSALDFVSNIGGKIIDKIWPNPEEAAKAKIELLKLQQAGEFKEIELRYQAIVAEAQSQDKWTSRARPSFMYIIYLFIVAAIPIGILSVFEPAKATAIATGANAWLSAIPTDMWMLFGAGYLGYGAYRSYDKAKTNGGSK
jgi:hypothetical protein